MSQNYFAKLLKDDEYDADDTYLKISDALVVHLGGCHNDSSACFGSALGLPPGT